MLLDLVDCMYVLCCMIWLTVCAVLHDLLTVSAMLHDSVHCMCYVTLFG